MKDGYRVQTGCWNCRHVCNSEVRATICREGGLPRKPMISSSAEERRARVAELQSRVVHDAGICMEWRAR